MSGTLTAEQVSHAAHGHYELRMMRDVDGFDMPQVTFDWQAIAEELNAIGGGECERVKHGVKPDGTPRWRCSICGYGLGDNRWAYCPKCGAKIRKVVKR